MPPKALSLPAAIAEEVRAGQPSVDLASLPDAGPAADAGRPLWLVDARGHTLASGLSDPENGLIRILSTDEIQVFDLAFFRTAVRRAYALRQALGLVEGDSAYRLINAEGDGLSGFVADVFGSHVVLYVYSRGLLGFGRLLADAIHEIAAPEGIILKVRPKHRPRPGKVRQEIRGKTPPERLVVRELGVPYEVHLLGGLNVGLFTDMRECRRTMARFVQGRRVLNTFAYTGALSVTAARGGAKSVTSVDLSSGVLKWARENFRLSGLEPDDSRYRFEVSDVSRFLQREAEASATYDTIILDPPTFSAARASSWSMKHDYPELIASAARLLPADTGGFLWVSANTLRGRSLPRQIKTGLGLCRREARVLEVAGLPPDYPTPLAYPQARYLEVYLLDVR